MVKIYNQSELGEKISEERNRLGNSLEAFSQKINITRQTLSRWEKGEGVGPSVSDLLRMCEIFNCDFGYLVGEYECRTRSETDIQAVTGLSEKSIERLEMLHLLEDNEALGFISSLLVNPYFITAIQEMSLAKSLEKSCKDRDAQKKVVKDFMEKAGVKQNEQSDFLQQFHIEADDSIMAAHHTERIELSPDKMAKLYFIMAKDSFLSAITDIWKGAENNGKHQGA